MDGRKAKNAEFTSYAGFPVKKISLPVKTWDGLTTVAAEKVLRGRCARAGRKKVIDKLAATLILKIICITCTKGGAVN